MFSQTALADEEMRASLRADLEQRLLDKAKASKEEVQEKSPLREFEKRISEAEGKGEPEAQEIDPAILEGDHDMALRVKGLKAEYGVIEATSRSKHIHQLLSQVEQLKNQNVAVRVQALNVKAIESAKHIGSKAVYTFEEGKIFQIHGSPDRITDIELGFGETLLSAPKAADSIRWTAEFMESGTGKAKKQHILVSPQELGIETNMIVSTNKRVYHLQLVSADWYQPTVTWRYPKEEEAIANFKLKKESQVETISCGPEKLNFGYTVKNNDEYSWAPLRVFDCEGKTYLQMSKGVKHRESPILFVRSEDGEPILTNYRVKGDYYIVDRLFERAELRVGKQSSVEVRSETYKPGFFEDLF